MWKLAVAPVGHRELLPVPWCPVCFVLSSVRAWCDRLLACSWQEGRNWPQTVLWLDTHPVCASVCVRRTHSSFFSIGLFYNMTLTYGNFLIFPLNIWGIFFFQMSHSLKYVICLFGNTAVFTSCYVSCSTCKQSKAEYALCKLFPLLWILHAAGSRFGKETQSVLVSAEESWFWTLWFLSCLRMQRRDYLSLRTRGNVSTVVSFLTVSAAAIKIGVFLVVSICVYQEERNKWWIGIDGKQANNSYRRLQLLRGPPLRRRRPLLSPVQARCSNWRPKVIFRDAWLHSQTLNTPHLTLKQKLGAGKKPGDHKMLPSLSLVWDYKY